jgi:hypothetical protein
MSATPTRGCLLFLAAALAASTGSGQREQKFPKEWEEALKRAGSRPYYTAFPDIKPSRDYHEVKQPDGKTKPEFTETLVPLPPLPSIAADAPPLRRVQFEQLQAGLAYFKSINEAMRTGAWRPQFFQDHLTMIGDVTRVAADLEEAPAKRVPWYEARVRMAKDFEQFITIGMATGEDPPQRLHQARFQRLQAEAELLRLKAEVEKAGKK